jgi:hypothetical protein
MGTVGKQFDSCLDSDFTVGMNVDIHPACGWFMRGAKHGVVTSIRNKRVYVQLYQGGAPVTSGEARRPVGFNSFNLRPSAEQTSTGLTIVLWEGTRLPTTEKTYKADARRALSGWMEKSDSIRAFDHDGMKMYVVYAYGEPTDAFARVERK